MRRIIAFAIATLLTIHWVKAQIYMGKTCDISFFSKGPVEDIYAKNTAAKPILNIKTGEVAIRITIKAFIFNSKLMEEHFNEKYLESDKYPYATFTGKTKDPINFSKDGTVKVTLVGTLNVHNVEQLRTIEGIATIKGGEISFDSKFLLALKDHKVEVPSLISQNIAESVEVTIKTTLTEFKSK